MKGPVHFAMTHSAIGGLREIWNDVAAGLAARGLVTGRFVLYPPERPEDAVGGEDWHHVVAERPRSPLAAVRMLGALVRYLRRERPTVVVTAMPAANVILPVAALLARTGTRVIVTHHSPTDTHSRKLDALDSRTGCLPSVEAVVSVSDAVAATLAHKPAPYRAKRLTIHNALPERVELLLDGLARSPRAEADPARIVALGRLTRQKNYPMLLDAIARTERALLKIVGGGEDEAALRDQVARLNIGDRVVFAGATSREAALEHAAAADIFVQVSLYEGHSLALIEAARLGLPLIVSDVPVQIEGVKLPDGEPAGAVVPLGDVGALARVIQSLADDGEARRRASALARELALGCSNERMIDAYQKVLARAGAGI
jgi:glycosyltransferase involved in cell wall biosynthesis